MGRAKEKVEHIPTHSFPHWTILLIAFFPINFEWNSFIIELNKLTTSNVLTFNVCTVISGNKHHKRILYVDQILNQTLKPLQLLSFLLTQESCHTFFFFFLSFIILGFSFRRWERLLLILVFFLKSPCMHFPMQRLGSVTDFSSVIQLLLLQPLIQLYSINNSGKYSSLYQLLLPL